MDYYAGIDVSLEQSSVCVVDGSGKIVREAKVASDSELLTGYFTGFGLPLVRIGLAAGPLSQWIHAGLVAAGFDVVLLETRHVKAALSAMTVKTDRKDARGIAQLLRMGGSAPSIASRRRRRRYERCWWGASCCKARCWISSWASGGCCVASG